MSEVPAPLRDRVGEPVVDDAAIDRVMAGVGRVRKARARNRAAMTVAVASGVLLAVAAVGRRATTEATLATVQPAAGVTRLGGESLAIRTLDRTQSVALSDGSTLWLAPRAQLAVIANDGTRVDWRLASGAAHFSVRPRGPRRWTVDAGLARISVIGTQFDVDRAPHSVDVRCTEGTVRVESSLLPEGVRVLHAGDHVLVSDEPPPVVRATADAQSAVEVDAAADASSAIGRPSRATPSRTDDDRAWRALAEHGDYGRAYELLGHEGVERESRVSSPEDLLALADVARLSGHPADAVAPLEALLAHHGRDGSAPLAAYTLGRVLLSLSRPADAARAFDRALAIGAPRAIEEDARLQLVRALAAAGDRAGAQRAAEDFRTRYGESRSAQSLQRWVGTTP